MVDPTLIARYTRHLAEDLHRAPKTVVGIREELTLLVRRGIPMERDALATHLTTLPDGRPLAPSTRNRRLAILRGFVRFLREIEELTDDPLLDIRRAKLVRRVRSALTADDLLRLVGALLARPPSVRRTRDGTLLLLFFYTGLRLSEVQRLRIEQVDLGAGLLRAALRKGGDRTDVVLHPTLAAQLAIWLAVRGDPGSFSRENDPTAPLVAGRDGEPLTTRSIQKALRRLGEVAGLGVPVHPHLLRHAHATGLLRQGVATAIIQQSMNHHALATTELYLHSDIGLLREAVGRLPVLPVVQGCFHVETHPE